MPEATPNSTPYRGAAKRLPSSSTTGTISLQLSSITPTASIEIVPRSRSVSYSSTAANATPTTPPTTKQAATAGSAVPGTSSRSNANVTNVTGTSAAPSIRTLGTRCRFPVRAVADTSSVYSASPATSVRSQPRPASVRTAVTRTASARA